MSKYILAETALSRLEAQGYALPQVPPPGNAKYAEYTRFGSTVYVAGQLPTIEGSLPRQGLLGRDVDFDAGQELARIAALNGLAVAAAAAGGLERVRMVQMLVFVASTPEFGNQSGVASAASSLLLDVLGSNGEHARTAVGVASLPLNSPVEIQMVCTTTECTVSWPARPQRQP